jgi:hypothetical protein
MLQIGDQVVELARKGLDAVDEAKAGKLSELELGELRDLRPAGQHDSYRDLATSLMLLELDHDSKEYSELESLLWDVSHAVLCAVDEEFRKESELNAAVEE